jgi:putative membrane-bound dehydrogenase-like protein
VEQQLAERPHRILRLEDVDGDGRFDRRTVFADKMMLPEGTMFVDGSLYVSAPPSIWKLTDADGDGVAESREEWFEGKTLTGCANDLHGPYFGLDGWVYWCKGAFAEQTHRVAGREWTTRAAHIFRRRLAGGDLEPVMTGGMDNPVDVTFSPEGERFLSATYYVGEGRRDGLAHVIYGGVYGKPHGVLDGHPRTGELMPALTWLGAAAPCGLERYAATAFGPEYRDNMFMCQFNLRKVSRHVLHPAGSSYTCDVSDFVTSEHVDFHPTDVFTDADGSLLVIDTGGWYKLCCPTSQLWKPDIMGGIYRVRRDGAAAVEDPRGRKLAWDGLSAEQLWSLLGDGRFAVRCRATRELVRRGEADGVRELLDRLAAGDGVHSPSAADAQSEVADERTVSLARLWALAQLESEAADALVRRALDDPDESVRHAAMHVVSLHRDGQATAKLLAILDGDTPASRRVAAEALGRLGDASAVPHLLAAAAGAVDDRILQHSLIYALIELADPEPTAAGLASNEAGTRAAALIALDQMPGGGVAADQVVPLLKSSDPALHDAARWLVGRHPEWGGELAGWVREQLASLPEENLEPNDSAAPRAGGELDGILVTYASHPVIQHLLADVVVDAQASHRARLAALRAMAKCKLGEPIPAWGAALAAVVEGADPALLAAAIEAARTRAASEQSDEGLERALLAASVAEALAPSVRVNALAALAPGAPLEDGQFQLLLAGLSVEQTTGTRSAAAQAISNARLNAEQLASLCTAMAAAGPLEINRLLGAFKASTDVELAGKLLASLKGASALASVRFDALRETLKPCGPGALQALNDLEAAVNVDAAAQRQQIQELLPRMSDGDVRRGEVVFYSSKAACTACHRLGIGGGVVGPDLSRVGEVRTERDLLESVLFPSLSFVRSYEPVTVATADGLSFNGTIRDENERDLVLATGPDQEKRILRAEIEEIQPSSVSVMPAGMGKVLSTQELADLVKFLKSRSEK